MGANITTESHNLASVSKQSTVNKNVLSATSEYIYIYIYLLGLTLSIIHSIICLIESYENIKIDSDSIISKSINIFIKPWTH